MCFRSVSIKLGIFQVKQLIMAGISLSGTQAFSQVLLQARAPIEDDVYCEYYLGRLPNIQYNRQTMICAGFYDGFTSACQVSFPIPPQEIQTILDRPVFMFATGMDQWLS